MKIKNDVVDELSEYIDEINFSNKAVYINHKYRVIFQVGRILLIIGIASRITGCSLIKLQFLSAALDDKYLFDKVECLIKKDEEMQISLLGEWRYNQLLNNAVKYCIADGLIVMSHTGLFTLSKKGLNMLSAIIEDDVMEKDKFYLDKISKKVSEKKLLGLLSGGIRL